jgi:hypothetical protein
MKILLSLFLVVSLQANPFIAFLSGSPPSAMSANLFLDFESGSNGDSVNATYLENNDIGTLPNFGGQSTWSIIGTTPTVSTADKHDLVSPVTVSGTTYSGQGGTRSVKFTHATEGEFLFQMQDDPATHDVTVGCWWKSTIADPDTLNGTYDYITLGGRHDGVNSAWGTFQLRCFDTGGFVVRAHAAGGSGVGSNITVSRDTWYWVVLQYKQADGCYLSIYNTSSTLVGTSYCPQSANVQGVRFVEFGNIEAHADFPTADVYFDSIAILWGTTTTFPVGP